MNLGIQLSLNRQGLGSSIGITKATKENIEEAIELAIKYDNKIIVEKYIDDSRELNVAVIGDYNNQKISMIEEVKKVLIY